MNQIPTEKFKKIAADVATVCAEVLRDLRNTPEEDWTQEDEGMFHLSGAYLLLYRETNLREIEIQRLLTVTANACVSTIDKYNNIPQAKWSPYDKSLHLMCNVYIQLFNAAVNAKKLSRVNNPNTLN